MALSNTWRVRLDRARVTGRSAGVVALCVGAAAGAAAGWRVFVDPEHPDIAGIAQQVGNARGQVGAFAADFVVAWLTATTTCGQSPGLVEASCRDADRAVLARYISVPDGATVLPRTPAAVVTIPQQVSVIASGTVGDADLYTAIVAVSERPYASAPPVRAFYQVPVSVWHFAPRALAMPARINSPGPGADLRLGYRQPLPPDSAVLAVVDGFLRAYLTSGSGLDRYVVAGTPLAPVGGYASTQVSSALAAEPIPEDPPPGAEVHVLATVAAQTSQFATVTMTYPLRVANHGGTWMIAGLDLVPAVTDTDPTVDRRIR
jgi:hypothetical protein